MGEKKAPAPKGAGLHKCTVEALWAVHRCTESASAGTAGRGVRYIATCILGPMIGGSGVVCHLASIMANAVRDVAKESAPGEILKVVIGELLDLFRPEADCLSFAEGEAVFGSQGHDLVRAVRCLEMLAESGVFFGEAKRGCDWVFTHGLEFWVGGRIRP